MGKPYELKEFLAQVEALLGGDLMYPAYEVLGREEAEFVHPSDAGETQRRRLPR